MWQIKRFITTITAAPLLILLPFGTPQVHADTTGSPSLVVSQIKITSSNGQFVTLYNATNAAIDLSTYQLQYFNNYDLTKATSSRTISLTGTLQPKNFYVVSDDMLQLCYKASVNSIALGFSSTAGMVQVVSTSQAGAGMPAFPTLHDHIAWSKTAIANVQTLPVSTSAFLQRQPVDSANRPNVKLPGAGSWQTVQPDPANPCKLVSTSSPNVAVSTGMAELLPATEPPAVVIGVEQDGSAISAPVMPAADIGLMSPVINELLPNPNGTGNDSSDEFIELYNPNKTAFDLTGFSMQTGMSTMKTYKFPAGSMLAPLSFTAFYSEATSLSLSNTTSRALLRDPFDRTISSSETYASAKDGQGWALAKGKWLWTTSLTPNAVNIVKQPIAKKKAGAAVKSKSTPAAKPKSPKPVAATALAHGDEGPETTPIHVRVLVMVVAAAILYGIYEYRTDMANYLRRRRSQP